MVRAHGPKQFCSVVADGARREQAGNEVDEAEGPDEQSDRAGDPTGDGQEVGRSQARGR